MHAEVLDDFKNADSSKLARTSLRPVLNSPKENSELGAAATSHLNGSWYPKSCRSHWAGVCCPVSVATSWRQHPVLQFIVTKSLLTRCFWHTPVAPCAPSQQHHTQRESSVVIEAGVAGRAMVMDLSARARPAPSTPWPGPASSGR